MGVPTKAVELAHSMERAAQNVKELKTKLEFSNPALTHQEAHTVRTDDLKFELLLIAFQSVAFGCWGEQKAYTQMWQARPYGSKLQSQQAYATSVRSVGISRGPKG